MNTETPDEIVLDGQWARLANTRPIPEIDVSALYQYRLGRLRQELVRADIGLCLLSNPLSLRYAADIRQYASFQARVPIMYLAVPVEGPVIVYGGLGSHSTESPSVISEARPARALTVFNGGLDISTQLKLFRTDIRSLVSELGVGDRRIAVENMTPTVPVALTQEGFEVFDAQVLLEQARLIKSCEEIDCMKWSIAVAEHAISKMREVLQPGVRENDLWALLNYVNVANDGESFDSRQLTSGPRTNPFGRESGDRAIEDGDLVAFDTDMLGPFGYCADISRTFHCGPSKPTAAHRDLYARAYEQLQHNIGLIKTGVSYREIGANAYLYAEGYRRENFVMHGIGMSDENPYITVTDEIGRMSDNGVVEPGMELCAEAYAGKIGGREGVKLEEQVLVTENGIEVLTRYPFESEMLGG